MKRRYWPAHKNQACPDVGAHACVGTHACVWSAHSCLCKRSCIRSRSCSCVLSYMGVCARLSMRSQAFSYAHSHAYSHVRSRACSCVLTYVHVCALVCAFVCLCALLCKRSCVGWYRCSSALRASMGRAGRCAGGNACRRLRGRREWNGHNQRKKYTHIEDMRDIKHSCSSPLSGPPPLLVPVLVVLPPFRLVRIDFH